LIQFRALREMPNHDEKRSIRIECPKESNAAEIKKTKTYKLLSTDGLVI
jgi:hypothetical protein